MNWMSWKPWVFLLVAFTIFFVGNYYLVEKPFQQRLSKHKKAQTNPLARAIKYTRFLVYNPPENPNITCTIMVVRNESKSMQCFPRSPTVQFPPNNVQDYEWEASHKGGI